MHLRRRRRQGSGDEGDGSEQFSVGGDDGSRRLAGDETKSRSKSRLSPSCGGEAGRLRFPTRAAVGEDEVGKCLEKALQSWES